MKLAFIADGRSDHSRRWIQYFVERHEVLLISPFACDPLPGARIVTLPGRFRLGAQLASKQPKPAGRPSLSGRLISGAVRSGLANRVWALLKLTDLFQQVRATRAALRAFGPDVVHALRTQNEGYLAAFSGAPRFIVSSWGSDFVDTAANSVMHRLLTRRALRRASYFMADCERDLRLADCFGLRPGIPKFYFPGNGGVDRDIFHPAPAPCQAPSILYCRGVSRVTRVETLFAAIAELEARTGLQASLTVLAAAATHPMFQELAQRSGMAPARLRVLDYVDAPGLAALMREHTVFVSPLVSDGVPNSMLEAMACGMIPVMSDLESIREFVRDGENGFLFNPESAPLLSGALERAFAARKAQFRSSNSDMIRSRVEYTSCLGRVTRIYEEIQLKKHESDV